jgi:plasmid stabilization system protein ParE
VARVELARAAVEDIDRLAMVLSLPDDTRERVRRSLAPLGHYPLLGPELTGRWEGFRFLLGPWRWMILVYVYEQLADRVVVVTVQDARSSRAATGQRGTRFE